MPAQSESHVMKPVLMLAFHFPPLAGSSGIQRTLRFVQHLPEYGWHPIVVSAHPRAYERISNDLTNEIPSNVLVKRAFALDTARHLSIRGRYPGCLALPDRWMFWYWGGVQAALSLIRQHKPRAMWSTFPIATAHRIGAEVHRRSGLPWVADFRDPMAQDGYPRDAKVWRTYQKIEVTAFRHAARCTVTTPSALRMYRQRYPEIAEDRIVLVENGYDEESFEGLSDNAAAKGPLNPGKVTLLHSGIVYPYERNPTQFFAAIRQLMDSGLLHPDRFALRLRASVHEEWLATLAAEQGVAPVVELAPPIPYREALEEMLRADGLVVLQANNCNAQIPAKIYEYLRAGRPMLGLTDLRGDTADVLTRAGCRHIAPLEGREEIARVLCELLGAIESRDAARPDASFVVNASRKNRARRLAELLDEAASGFAE